jgi:hypothetical protein
MALQIASGPTIIPEPHEAKLRRKATATLGIVRPSLQEEDAERGWARLSYFC